MNWLTNLLSERTRENLSLRWFGLTRIPLLFYVGVLFINLMASRSGTH